MTVTNSSFDGNTAAGFGGAIDSFGGGTTAMNVISSTFTRNKANVENTGPARAAERCKTETAPSRSGTR